MGILGYSNEKFNLTINGVILMSKVVDNTEIIEHYQGSNLYESIVDGLRKAGLNMDNLSPENLSAADEFHIGGTEATDFVCDKVGDFAGQKLLDVGCGIGGPARFISNRMGCEVVGVDLTPDFVRTGNLLTGLVSMTNAVTLMEGNAAELSFPPSSFDAAYMMHVGMNISDKRGTFKEVNRVLKDRGLFVIYDVMCLKEQQLTYPLPWASNKEGSAVDAPETYQSILEAEGFAVTEIDVKRDFAVGFFENMMKKMEGGPPPLGLHLVMGSNTAVKVQNVHRQIVDGLLAPVLMVAKKRN